MTEPYSPGGPVPPQVPAGFPTGQPPQFNPPSGPMPMNQPSAQPQQPSPQPQYPGQFGQPASPGYGAPAAPAAQPAQPNFVTPSAPPQSQPPQQPQQTQQPQNPYQGQPQQQVPEPPAPPRPENRRVGLSTERAEGDIELDSVLRQMLAVGASDLHLTAGAPPMVRKDGSLSPLDGYGPLTPESLQRSLYAAITQKQREKFEDALELDFAYSVRGAARFRVNMYFQREAIGGAFRVIPYEIKPLEELGIPAVVGSFANLPRGLVLVTGPTGSGKSTTLASIIDLANRTRPDHIMTVEDPIEFLHRHKKAIINQREVGADTLSFNNALKHVLRQDPDIILVGELRDLETISVALTAAETGHLVFATLHTQDAAQTIDRLIDVFPAHQQDQIRVQVASALQAVVCQTLAKRSDGPGRAVATEVMIATPAVRNLVREGKTHQIYSAMQAGASQGMHTMDQTLAELVRKGRISYETGLEKCHHAEDFNRLTGRMGGSTGAGLAKASMGAEGYNGVK